MSDVALRARVIVAGGVELVDAFEERALAIASSAAAPNTRRSYATAYRAFAAFLRARYGSASVETLTLAAVAGWRDELTAWGPAPTSVAQRISAVRRLAAAIGADPLVAHPLHPRPTAAPERPLRSRALGAARPPGPAHDDRGRDRAILELLARAGLRRSELAWLTLADIQ